MQKKTDTNEQTNTTNTSPEPVSQHAFSKCIAHSYLLPEITPTLQNNSTGTSPNPTPRPNNLFTEPPATDEGFTNAPASFKRLLEHVLRDYIGKFVILYIDDILWEFFKMCLKFPLSIYTLLRSHNIA